MRGDAKKLIRHETRQSQGTPLLMGHAEEQNFLRPIPNQAHHGLGVCAELHAHADFMVAQHHGNSPVAPAYVE